jgi:methyltransferase
VEPLTENISANISGDFILNVSWILLIATICERFVELYISKRNAAWSFKQGGIEYGADHYKWMVIMHTLFLVAILLEYFWFGSDLAAGIRLGAVVLAVLCQVSRWWIIQTLGYQWNTRVIIVPGLTRVLAGPYKFLKHPNYVVVALETAVLPLVFGSWRTSLVFSILNAWMMTVRLRVENSALLKLRSL